MATACIGGMERSHIKGKGKCTRDQAFTVGSKGKEVNFLELN